MLACVGSAHRVESAMLWCLQSPELGPSCRRPPAPPTAAPPPAPHYSVTHCVTHCVTHDVC
eukprot:1849399-Prymnesium_polylepis.1